MTFLLITANLIAGGMLAFAKLEVSDPLLLGKRLGTLFRICAPDAMPPSM